VIAWVLRVVCRRPADQGDSAAGNRPAAVTQVVSGEDGTMSVLSKGRLLAGLTAVAAFAALSAGSALAAPPSGITHRPLVTAATAVSVPLVSSGSNSLCVNPVGVSWGDGVSPPVTLPTSPTCAPPASLQGQNTAIVQGPPGAAACAYTGKISGASWVGIDPAGQCSDLANPPLRSPYTPRFYVYDTEFTLPACVTSVSIQGSMLADNAAAVYLNGNLIGNQSSVGGGPATNFNGTGPGLLPTPFGPEGSFFDLNATNVLDFLVLDHTTPETGLDFGATVTYTPCLATLKICKVAGFGIFAGQHFKFTMSPAPVSGSGTVSVPAGPAPGGYCVVAGTFVQGTDVTVTESIPSADSVSSIGVGPPGNQVGAANLGTGTVEVAVGQGVTEATYTNVSNLAEQNSGYLEICKRAIISDPWLRFLSPTPTFEFTVGGQSIGGAHTQSQTVGVPGGACSSPIQVLAGPVTVTENLSGTWNMVGCGLADGGTLTACNLAGHSATVTVPAGDVSAEAVLTITNSGYVLPIKATTCLNCMVDFGKVTPLGGGDTGTGTVVGTATGGTPTGTMSFYECGPAATPQPCTSTANPVGSPVTLVPGTKHTATATAVPFSPGTAGYWCLAEYYSGDGNYPASSDTSTDGCFHATSTALQITTVTIPFAQVGVPYSTQLAVTGGTAPYKWTATGLPKGFTLNAKTGLLTGKPTAAVAGVYSPVVTVKDSSKQVKSSTATLTLLVATAPAITSASSATFTIGSPGTFTVTTTGFPAPGLSETGALPDGVTFTDNGDGTATLAGTATDGAGQSFPITITADNGVGTAATQDFTLTVIPGPAPSARTAPATTAAPA
jgi:Putative Ig domain